MSSIFIQSMFELEIQVYPLLHAREETMWSVCVCCFLCQCGGRWGMQLNWRFGNVLLKWCLVETYVATGQTSLLITSIRPPNTHTCTPDKDQGQREDADRSAFFRKYLFVTQVPSSASLLEESSQPVSPGERHLGTGSICCSYENKKPYDTAAVWVYAQTPTNTHLASPQFFTQFPWAKRGLRHKTDVRLIKD